MKKAKRFLATILCVTLLAGIVTVAPFSVNAAETTSNVVDLKGEQPSKLEETVPNEKLEETKPSESTNSKKLEDTVGASAEADGFTYTIIDNKVTITGFDKSKTGAVVVPDTIDGYEVVSIGESAFANCSRLESVELPASVTSIGHYAFQNDVSLSLVTLGGAKTLGQNLFEGCD